MPKKPISAMTPHEFTMCLGALKVPAYELARMLNRTPTCISHYRNGKSPIPDSIANALANLLQHKAVEIKSHSQARVESIQDLAARVNAATNQLRLESIRDGSLVERTNGIDGRLPNRQSHDPRLEVCHPKYRVRARYSTAVVAALRSWAKRVVELSRVAQYSTEAHQRDYRLELADVAAILAGIPEAARGGSGQAFDVVITEREWTVVSRALRQAAGGQSGTGPTRVLYQHWRKHRFVGYPRVTTVVTDVRSTGGANDTQGD